MVWETILGVFVVVFLTLMIIAVFWIVKLVQTIRQFISTVQRIVADRDEQVKEILKNISTVTYDVRSTTKRVDETVRHVVSIPDIAAQVGKGLLSGLFRKEKR